MHCVLPASFWYCPISHSVHVVLPTMLLYDPTWQLIHVEFKTVLYLPTGQLGTTVVAVRVAICVQIGKVVNVPLAVQDVLPLPEYPVSHATVTVCPTVPIKREDEKI